MAFNEAEERLNRPMGLLREEARAFSDEYDFVHRAWTLNDISRLRNMINPEPGQEAIKILREVGLLAENGQGTAVGKQFSKLSDEEKLAAMALLRGWISYRQDIDFVDKIEEILSTPKHAFVKKRLQLYRSEQVHRNIVLRAKKYFPSGLVDVFDTLGIFNLISRRYKFR